MSQKTISYYTCECGKKFSGEINKNRLMIKLHHKRCTKPTILEPPPVIVNFDVYICGVANTSPKVISPNGPYL
jgi:hypothetical protein